MKPAIKEFKTADEMAEYAAEYVLKKAKDCVKEKGFFTIALSGGQTPIKLHMALAAAPFKEKMPWQKTYIFWGDDRCVPPTDIHSNYKMADDTLLSKISIPDGNIHRILAEIKPPEKAAQLYENDIKAFSKTYSGTELLSFDLQIMGIGFDGHTASLFPDDPILNENEKLVAAVNAPEDIPVKKRITFTLPLINNSDEIIFLVSGEEKIKLARKILNDPEKSRLLYPAALVYPKGRLVWCLNEGKD